MASLSLNSGKTCPADRLALLLYWTPCTGLQDTPRKALQILPSAPSLCARTYRTLTDPQTATSLPTREDHASWYRGDEAQPTQPSRTQCPGITAGKKRRHPFLSLETPFSFSRHGSFGIYSYVNDMLGHEMDKFLGSRGIYHGPHQSSKIKRVKPRNPVFMKLLC